MCMYKFNNFTTYWLYIIYITYIWSFRIQIFYCLNKYSNKVKISPSFDL